jgi:hypothetical protein
MPPIVQNAKILLNFIFLRSNRRILPSIIKIMCEKTFKKADHIDYKIIAFKVKKSFFASCKQNKQTLNPLG